MMPYLSPRASALSLCLCLFLGCAPAAELAPPGDARESPADESAVLGVWSYGVSGSCFLLHGEITIVRDSGGLAGQLVERPFPANFGPDPLQLQQDRQRCIGGRSVPVTIALEVSFDGETLVFSGATAPEMPDRFRLRARALVGGGSMSGSLAISGSLDNIIRNESATFKAQRERRGEQQPYEAGVGAAH